MKKLLVLLLFLSIPLLAQDVLTSTIPAGSTYGSAIKLYKGESLLGVYADSLNTVTTLSFYIHIGDTTGVGTDSSKYMALGSVSDTAIYSVPLTKMKYVAFNTSLFYSLMPGIYLSQAVFLIPKIANAQAYNKIIKFKAGLNIIPIVK
ncbi:MAG: hypothetical protein ACYDBV_11185 [Nitrospiria bacterium]